MLYTEEYVMAAIEQEFYTEYLCEFDYTCRLMQVIADLCRAHYHTYIPPTLSEDSYSYRQEKHETIVDIKNSLVDVLGDFQVIGYGNEVKTEDIQYRRFVWMIESVLKKAGEGLYETDEFDTNLMVIVAILGLLHPNHISDKLDIREIVQNCLLKHENEIRQCGALHSLRGEVSDNPLSHELDTLYLYLLHVFTAEQKLPNGYIYFRDRNLSYRSGVVYHLLKSGSVWSDLCLDVMLSFDRVNRYKHSERAIDIIKDFIFTCNNLDDSTRRCRITDYVINHCFRMPTIEDDHWTVYHSECVMLGEKESFLFWELAALDIFCQHHSCLDYESKLKDCYPQGHPLFKSVVTAMSSTPKSLKNLCRISIRKSLNPSEVVPSCLKLTRIPTKLRNYVAFGSFDAPIKAFYNMADMRMAMKTHRGDREISFEDKKELVIKVLQTYNLEFIRY